MKHMFGVHLSGYLCGKRPLRFVVHALACRFSLLALLWPLLLLTGNTASAQQFLVLRTNGPTASRINIVFLSEGYLSNQVSQFTNNAITILSQILITSPFSDYTNYFNAFGIFVASAQAGSDHPSSNYSVNTYFNSTYDSYGTDRLITIPPNDRDSNPANGQGKVDALLQTYMPEWDLRLLVVNDTNYGGSGGSVIISSVNIYSPEIGVHELGHRYAGLGDEYSDPYPGYPDVEEPNTTQETNRTSIKWHPWILDTTPIPTPTTYTTAIGLFQGAHYHATNWYRPKYDCKMRTLGVDFCEVCMEALVASTYNYARPIESVSPATNSVVQLTNNHDLVLSATPLQPSTFNLQAQWYTNNTAVAGATNMTLTLPGVLLPLGTNTVRALVWDPTTKVRIATNLTRLQDSRIWKVNVHEGPPKFQSVTTPTNSIKLTFSGGGQNRCKLEVSTNLVLWSQLQIFTNTGSAHTYSEIRGTNAMRRFYRAVEMP